MGYKGYSKGYTATSSVADPDNFDAGPDPAL
jgi:hypothetical protein